jgi:hypothetical protein
LLLHSTVLSSIHRDLVRRTPGRGGWRAVED